VHSDVDEDRGRAAAATPSPRAALARRGGVHRSQSPAQAVAARGVDCGDRFGGPIRRARGRTAAGWRTEAGRAVAAASARYPHLPADWSGVARGGVRPGYRPGAGRRLATPFAARERSGCDAAGLGGGEGSVATAARPRCPRAAGPAEGLAQAWPRGACTGARCRVRDLSPEAIRSDAAQVPGAKRPSRRSRPERSRIAARSRRGALPVPEPRAREQRSWSGSAPGHSRRRAPLNDYRADVVDRGERAGGDRAACGGRAPGAMRREYADEDARIWSTSSGEDDEALADVVRTRADGEVQTRRAALPSCASADSGSILPTLRSCPTAISRKRLEQAIKELRCGHHRPRPGRGGRRDDPQSEYRRRPLACARRRHRGPADYTILKSNTIVRWEGEP